MLKLTKQSFTLLIKKSVGSVSMSSNSDHSPQREQNSVSQSGEAPQQVDSFIALLSYNIKPVLARVKEPVVL